LCLEFNISTDRELPHLFHFDNNDHEFAYDKSLQSLTEEDGTGFPGPATALPVHAAVHVLPELEGMGPTGGKSAVQAVLAPHCPTAAVRTALQLQEASHERAREEVQEARPIISASTIASHRDR
jgi:hypothetical protein